MNDIRLYRRNNKGAPCVWYATPSVQAPNVYFIYHGIVGKTIVCEAITCTRNPLKEIESKYKAKRKQGYKFLYELKDDCQLPPVEETHTLITFLNAYLPYDRTNADGVLLPMLAKTYDNTNNKVFNRCSNYIGQYKINGLRCVITAYRRETDLFNPIGLLFQSREGRYWNSLKTLEEYLINHLPQALLYKMIEEDWQLDGEVYLPGYDVNEINHFVKDPTCIENKLLQYWCYDIAIEDVPQHKRTEILNQSLENFTCKFNDRDSHLRCTQKLIYLQPYEIDSNESAINHRNKFISYGFEGLILRNPNSEYQYGARNYAMLKFKDVTDGIFEIVDIYAEGVKRDLPLLLCRNDINNNTFEVHINGTFEYQHEILINKHKYIGKKLFITFGERSGVTKVPFHVKTVKFADGGNI